MEFEHFKLSTPDEVALFCKRLDQYQVNRSGDALPYIDLVSSFKNLQDFPEGGKLFTALLDLKLNFVMLHTDMMKAAVTWSQFFSKDKLAGGSVLDDQQKFDGKTDIQYYFTNFITRYRALWDKLMGILLLMYQADRYDEFRRARSRKKAFQKICNGITQIPNDFVEDILKHISEFDQEFRTPEVHGTGSLRKWTFTMFSLHETPSIKLIGYWNLLLPVLTQIDQILRNEPPPENAG